MYYTKIMNVLVVVHGGGGGGAETREASPLLLTLILTLVYKQFVPGLNAPESLWIDHCNGLFIVLLIICAS